MLEIMQGMISLFKKEKTEMTTGDVLTDSNVVHCLIFIIVFLRRNHRSQFTSGIFCKLIDT